MHNAFQLMPASRLTLRPAVDGAILEILEMQVSRVRTDQTDSPGMDQRSQLEAGGGSPLVPCIIIKVSSGCNLPPPPTSSNVLLGESDARPTKHASC